MNSKKFVNLLAYFAIGLMAVCVLASFLMQKFFNINSNIIDLVEKVTYYVVAVVTLFSAFIYAYSKRNKTYMFVLVIFLVVIIVFGFVLK